MNNMFPFGASFTGGWLESILKFMFIGLCLAILIFLLKLFLSPKDLGRDVKSEEQSISEALDILRKRYARGDIEESEFLHKEKQLKK